MSPVKPPETLNRDVQWGTAKPLWEAIRAHLEAKKTLIYDEIAHYPAPIPACDQHFNYLLEERTNIAREWRRLHAFSEESLASGDPLAWLDAFIRTSPCISDAAAQNIRTALQVERPSPED